MCKQQQQQEIAFQTLNVCLCVRARVSMMRVLTAIESIQLYVEMINHSR